MCCSCGCVIDGTGIPDGDHGDSRSITLAGLCAAADAAGISPAQAAANIVASAQLAGTPAGVLKSAGEPQRYVLGIAYQAGPDPRITKGVDGGRDYFTPEELEKAAWQCLRNGPQVGLFHADGTEGAAEIVESYIYRGPDWDLGDGIVAKSGDWLLGAILSPQAWQMKLDGKLNGFSPQGSARRRRLVAKAAEQVAVPLTVTGPQDQIVSFLQLCATIGWMCAAGASRTVQIDVDGDGSGALRFDVGDLEMPPVDESQIGSDIVRMPGIGG